MDDVSFYVIHIFHHFEICNIICAVCVGNVSLQCHLRGEPYCAHVSQEPVPCVPAHTQPSSPFLVKTNTTGLKRTHNYRAEMSLFALRQHVHEGLAQTYPCSAPPGDFTILNLLLKLGSHVFTSKLNKPPSFLLRHGQE